MSFYRNMLVAVAVMSLGTAVFAEDTGITNTTTTETTTATQPSDTTMQTTTGDTQATTSSTTTTTTTTDKIDLNTASAKQLMKIKGINAARAKAIVRYRKEHGNFKSLDELREVKGFKKLNTKKWQTIEENLTVS